MIANITLIAIYLVFLVTFIQDYRKHSRMLRLYEQELQYVSNCYLNQLDIVRHLKYKRSITMAKWGCNEILPVSGRLALLLLV